MPTVPSPAQSEASRLNGSRSTGPASEAGKARAALNGVRHGLSGGTFFLLADEDPAEFERHEAMWLAAWAPRDAQEREAAEPPSAACGARSAPTGWRRSCSPTCSPPAKLPDPAEAEAAKSAAFKALNTLLRYRARIERERAQAMQALEALRQRRPARATAPRPSEPEAARPAASRYACRVACAPPRAANRTRAPRP